MFSFECLIQLRLANDLGLLVLIWLVQVIIYPSFGFIREDKFIGWHSRYTGWITVFVVPLMFTQVGLVIVESIFYFSWFTAVSVSAVLICWIVTFTLSAPTHGQLQEKGNLPNLVRWLVLTNWVRTIGWTIVFASTCWAWSRTVFG